MKKTKFLSLVLVVAIMMMGAGYAAWQETLTINHTVSTGNVDVDLANGAAKYYKNMTIATEDGLVRSGSSVVGSEQEATVTLTNLYPGGKVVVTIPVINNSTIPVKYKTTTSEGVPAWLNITHEQTADLAVGDTGKIVITMEVKDDAEENANATFKLTPVYEQWNTK